jgi:hypothetical protein
MGGARRGGIASMKNQSSPCSAWSIIDADDFRTMNRCLDDAIAAAVTEYAH